MNTIIDFDVPFDGKVLKADHYVGRDSNRILYLHGAGGSTRRARCRSRWWSSAPAWGHTTPFA